MKNVLILIIFVMTGAVMLSCNKTRRNTGRAYMPDMAYSRAYETYAALDSSKFTYSLEDLGEGKAYFNPQPVSGTVAREDMPAYPYKNDSTGYNLSKNIINPLPALDSMQMKEAERLYLVNCAICHGSKLDGNGPLWRGGDGPYPAAPRNLLDEYSKSLADGQIYHVIVHGKGQMGSYASQLRPAQRWHVVNYIRSKQGVSPTAENPTTVNDTTNSQ